MIQRNSVHIVGYCITVLQTVLCKEIWLACGQ